MLDMCSRDIYSTNDDITVMNRHKVLDSHHMDPDGHCITIVLAYHMYPEHRLLLTIDSSHDYSIRRQSTWELRLADRYATARGVVCFWLYDESCTGSAIEWPAHDHP
jgi:hypothetical protein